MTKPRNSNIVFRDAYGGLLLIGGLPDNHREIDLATHVDVVVVCCPLPDGWRSAKPCVHVAFDDSMFGMSENDKNAATRLAEIGHLLLVNDKRVLVACRQGINRSALVAALVLLHVGAGWTADEVVSMVRSGRPGALTNQGFVRFIQEQHALLGREVP